MADAVLGGSLVFGERMLAVSLILTILRRDAAVVVIRHPPLSSAKDMSTITGGNFRGSSVNDAFSCVVVVPWCDYDSTDHRLLYVTPELTDSLHLSGKAKVKIRLASSKPAANLSVWLVSLPWKEGRRGKITDNLITRGWADPQNHSSMTEGEPLEPGKFYDLSFELQPDDQIIPSGQQIGLMIFSSDRDFTLWPDPGTELTIDLDATELHLPVVGGEGKW